MEKKNKKLKDLNELKFDSVGDEYLYLFETLSDTDYANSINREQVNIEKLRELYTELLKNNTLDVKYKDSKRYWFKEQEKAIVDFIKCEDEAERNRIFNKHLYKPLNKLIENIIFTYKLFRSDSNVKDIQQECLSFLMTKLEKFNPKTGAQAFSYFGTIAKHYLMGEQRNAYKLIKSNIDIDENLDEASEKPEYSYELNLDEEIIDMNFEIFNEVIKILEKDVEKGNPKFNQNDIKVAEAIVCLFKTHKLLGYYNKIKIYYFFKERTYLTTKEITSSITKLKKYYNNMKTSYIKKRNK